MASLDTLRGYAQNRYNNEVRQYAPTQYVSQTQALGYQVLTEPMWNKGESALVVLPLLSRFPARFLPIFLLCLCLPSFVGGGGGWSFPSPLRPIFWL